MKLKKSLVAASVITTLGLGSLVGLQTALAAPNGGSSMTELANTIAERFGISQDEVQAIFDEQHEAMKIEHEAANQERLTQAVSDGNLTQEQADLITAKQSELQAQNEALKDADPEDRQAARQSHKEELETWAEENGIPLEYLHGGGRGGHGGPHGQRGPVSDGSAS